MAIFWDLDNKPPNPFGPYEAALKLRKTASSFGFVRDMIAYANRHSLSSVPKAIREQRRKRRALDQLENRGAVKPQEPYHCGVCGRNFYHHEKLLNHFKQIHDRENVKRLNQIESARGSRRVKLVAKYSMKMEKFKRAAREVLTPKAGCYGLRDELERAGFRVGSVEDRPQAADIAMRNHMVEVMDKRRAECLVLVSDDYGFADILKEAKMRCIKTVVVGNHVVDGGSGGALKRVADSGFCWTEIMRGKAKKEAVSVIRKWKDRDILERLEWRYDPEAEKSVCGLDDKESIESCVDEEEDDDGCEQLDRSSSWWELELESDDVRSWPGK